MKCILLLLVLASLQPIDAESVSLDDLSKLDGSPASLQSLCVDERYDALIAAEPSKALAVIELRSVPMAVRYYVAGRLVGSPSLTNEESLILHGMLYNILIVYNPSQAWGLLQRWYHSIPSSMHAPEVLRRMRDAGWKITDKQFYTFTSGVPKMGIPVSPFYKTVPK